MARLGSGKAMNDVIDNLQALGFSAYESRAYVALLAQQPVTAYELAKSAGIPSSKIYETVARLIDRQVARPVESGSDSKQRYAALPPGDMLARIRADTVQRTEALVPVLEDLTREPEADLIWPVNAEDVRTLACSMVTEARETILLSLWREELDWLGPSLRAREADGMQIALVHFGEPSTKIGATYHHPVERTLFKEKGGRGLTLVTDSEQVLIADFRADGGFEGSWSRNGAFVTVAEDYVKHDVYITKVTRFLEGPMRERFGSEYEALRDVFNADA